MYNYTITVTLKTFHGIFKPTVERFEFSFCAGSRDEAISLASANVQSKGFPHGEKSVRVIEAIPVGTTALAVYDPRLHVFDWTTVANHAETALINQCASLRRQNELTIASVREATKVVNELTRAFGG